MNYYENILIYLITFSIIILLANIYYMYDDKLKKKIIKPKETVIQKNTRILQDVIKKNLPK